MAKVKCMIKSNGGNTQTKDTVFWRRVQKETNVFKSERDKGAEVKKEREGGVGGWGARSVALI